MHGTARRREVMDRCFELVPILQQRRQQLAGNLSGGQRQMVAVSVGLMGDPKPCVFNEPALGLAPIVIQQSGETPQAMRKLHLALLLIEQNAKLASSVADHICVISAGRVQCHDTPNAMGRNAEVLEKLLSA